MTSTLTSVPFVDLSFIHDPLKPEIQAAIQAVIDKGDFVLGQALTELEIAFAQACGVQYGVGVACGTDAIALGLQACGIQPGDEVLIPANTFIATLIGVLHAGATPILVDCEPHTALIDLNQADKLVTSKTKAIIPVHLYGQMVSPHQLFAFAASHNLIIFEDAAQAHLADRESYCAGSIGLAAAFSFYPGKNLGAFGDGGMVVTQNETVARNLRSLRNYGAPQKYFHTERGTNSRLDTLQAAILKVKLPHLNGWNRDRNFAAEKYDASLLLLREKGIIPIENQSADGHVYHLYVIRVTEDCAISRDTLQNKLTEQGIQVGIHYPIPCHLQPAYQNLGYKEGDFPQTEKLSQQILSLPMYPGLTTNQINHVLTAIQSAITA
ncbi:Pleiotropic regulatory protein [Planktothrix tepida]|uniref:Pleiotropic regulatory protein n=2 Tax=Planktothrix TaxID=54304 RepID=A0A1J1LG83_9CYAN|nr:MULTISPECIES: DegT/DnrJ/EryC1/StrS family aminotransferase [Planktothrix]CAD5915002.1 Pleiotropic regulatory protein [Planktothrix tepida]CAD5986049.1 Pleiotropic regulatory protein [Planktothrix pseudagardhii]CUR30585.1 Pleiotropic regulatory protein [Planktothrix tepida PCC 9214]